MIASIGTAELLVVLGLVLVLFGSRKLPELARHLRHDFKKGCHKDEESSSHQCHKEDEKL